MNTRINSHPDIATLMSFAAGGLSEPLAAAVSAHAWMCGECRDELHDMELIGAALLGASSAARAHHGNVAAPSRPQEPAAAQACATDRSEIEDGLPAPIARKYGLAIDQIPWKRLGPGVWQHPLALSPGVEGELYLLKLAAGCKLPVHGHGGTELTLVIAGAFADASGEYRSGDLQEADEDIEHQPVGHEEIGCICLVAGERPAVLKG